MISRDEYLLYIRESYLEIEFKVSDRTGGIIANDANIRFVNYGVIILFFSISLETISGETIEYIDHCYSVIQHY